MGVKNNCRPYLFYDFYPKNRKLRKKGYKISISIEPPQVKDLEERLSYGFENVKDTTLNNGDVLWSGEIKISSQYTAVFKTVKASDKNYFFCFWISCEDGYEAISKEEISKWVLMCVIEEKIRYYSD